MELSIFLIIFLGVQIFFNLTLHFVYQIIGFQHWFFFILNIGLFVTVRLKKPGYLIKQPQNFDQKEQTFEQQVHNERQKSREIENQRFCQICQVKQKLRSKHCKACNSCVATHDHHCPWIQNCVGEKNKPIFLLFILSLSYQCVITQVDLVAKLYEIGDVHDRFGIFLTSMLGICICLFGTLLIFQSWVMIANITTCTRIITKGEYLRWERITYLSSMKKGKSPFNLGFWRNLLIYWKFCGSDLVDWEQYYVGEVQQQ